MIHNGHCFHCGQPMVAGSNECGNIFCRMDECARPIWPWSRCADDETSAFRMFTGRNLLIWLLLPISGILLFLLGNIFVSGRLVNIGLTSLAGWFLSRYLLSLVRNANTKLFIREESRRNAQERYNQRLPYTDEPSPRKELDDEYDAVEHDQWFVRGFKWLKLTANLATAMLIMFFVLSWGPGNIFPWNIKNWTYNKVENVINHPLTKSVVTDAKRELSWGKHQLNYLENSLRRQRGVAFWQFNNIINNQYFNTKEVIEILKTTELRGDKLYAYIWQQMKPAAASAAPTSALEVGNKGYFQQIREIYWQLMLIMNLLLFIFVAGSFILMPISFLVAKGISFADEIRDIVKQKIEEMQAKREEKADAKATPAMAVIKKAVSGEEGRHGIFSIGLISLITDLIFDKLLKRFFN